MSWDDFRAEFLKRGGDKYYGAWQLTYNEPLFYNRMFRHRSDLVRGQYNQGMCPNAEYVQPKIKQFKTNYTDMRKARQQADILKSTLEHYN